MDHKDTRSPTLIQPTRWTHTLDATSLRNSPAMTPTQRRASSSMTLDISDDKAVDDNDTKTSPIQQRIIDFSVNPAALNCKTYDCVPLVFKWMRVVARL